MNQFLASDPCKSSWVTASAGSGKTKVLIDRLLRLLIDGVPFSSILCFTYTTIAATEMKLRLRQKLLSLYESDDVEGLLSELLHRSPTQTEIERSKSLYLDFIKDINALRIQTIHSFCKDFIAKFSVYVEIYGEISVIDQIEAQNVLMHVQETCITEDDNDNDFYNNSAAENFQILLQYLTFDQINDNLFALLSKRYDFSKFLKTYDYEKFNTFLKNTLSFNGTSNYFDEDKTQELAMFLDTLFPDNKTIRNILNKDYEKAFLTTTNTLRKKLQGLPVSHQLYEQMYEQAQNFFLDLTNQKTQAFISKTQAFISIANYIFQKYQQIKAENNQYDFDDLIMTTNNILEKASTDEILKRNISLGIKHIFIDEAQDISPQQWQVTLQLVNLFFNTPQHTLFVVGDIKQSIYGFQGAKPWLFRTLQVVFKKLIENNGGIFQIIELTKSYRTAQVILHVVDTVFQKFSKGMVDNYSCHVPARNISGFVQIITVGETNGDVSTNDTNSENDIFDAVVVCVSELLQRKIFCNCVNRIITPSDILILTKRRTSLRAIGLKLLSKSIQCTLPISRNLVWMDLCAFVQFLSNPLDDYNLACLLKSPFLQDNALTEEQLFLLCHKRTSFLWTIILSDDVVNERLKIANGDLCSIIKSTLLPYIEESNRIKTSADFYIFFHRALTHVKPYFSKFYDTSHFDVFLEKVCVFLEKNSPNLVEFSKFLQNSTFKMQQKDCEVRLMTIHGAKGLQAPIVILVDDSVVSIQKEKWVWFEDKSEEKYDLEFSSFFAKGVMLLPPVSLTNAKNIRSFVLDKLVEENQRLLYVAMTRAQDGLISIGRNKDNSWHKMIFEAMNESCFVGKYEDVLHKQDVESISLNDHEVLRVKFDTYIQNSELYHSQEQSTFFVPKIEQYELSHKSEEAQLGILIHDFVQKIAKMERTEVLIFLKKLISTHAKWSFMSTLAENVVQIVNQKEFFYIKNGRPEVSIQNDGQTFRVDYLYISEDSAIIIELKTGILNYTEIPLQYEQQLTNYCEIVAKIFPTKKVKAYFLLFDSASFIPFEYH
jgi:ATP-dependent helicase/nuclease subunit A